MYAYIQKAWFRGFQNPQMNLNFPQKDGNAKTINIVCRAKVRGQKIITGLFENFSQNGGEAGLPNLLQIICKTLKWLKTNKHFFFERGVPKKGGVRYLEKFPKYLVNLFSPKGKG